MSSAISARLATATAIAVMTGGCLSGSGISPERALAERAAIHHDLRNDTGTLYTIAAKRAKADRADLHDRRVVCAIGGVDIQFASETHATYTVDYACGADPWRPGRDTPAATPSVKLDLLKESGTWMINGFL